MSQLFLKIVNMSISAGWLVLAVLLLRLVLKKAPKWVSVLLWGMVAVRLICPFSFESMLSLIPSAETVSPEIMMDRTPTVSTGIETLDTVINPVITESFTPEPIASANPLQILIPVCANLWILVFLGMLIYTAVSYFLLRYKVATAVRLKGNIYQSENVASPFVLGVVRPRIYLPFRMEERDLGHVIAHEEAHIRRKDHWWKPLGFVLLSLHWFNPLMWIGYILLCRDIELACDEKVIQEMDNGAKADYTEALVACSVNRRRIAACPLAFGEVGVKERVKTVMNYKKPTFWIIIAAVAICIVVAVCFLTNPKGYGPEVGNPQMLEFPGVEWFVTPDELKEALNITEEQIVDEYMDPEKEDVGNDYDTHYLFVKDLTIFDKKVTYGCFEFRRYPGYDFAFDNAIVMFAEDTDMVALKEEVSEIYGLGVGETYDYFTYENDTKRTRTYKSMMTQQLEYMAHSAIKLEGVEGNPFKDALEDPEYMVHLWITENGTSVIPEEIVTYFKHLMDQPINDDKVVLQDEAKLTEMLDSWPWISISMSNRCMATIYSEAEGRDGEPYSYYTDNYMEFSAQWLWQYVYVSKEYMQNAAEEDTSSLQVDDPSLLEFPGVKWGMTPEEVKAALGVADEQIIGEGASGNRWRLRVQNITLFGEKVTMGEFHFVSFSDNTPYALSDVDLYYPDETDMDAVKEALTNTYGAPKDGTGFTRYRIRQGVVEEDISDGIDLGYYEGASRTISYWESAAKQIDVLPVDVQEKMVETGMVDVSGIGSGLDTADPATREIVQDYLQKESAVLLYCTDSDKMGKYDAPYSRNRVSFSATNYISMIQYHRK